MLSDAQALCILPQSAPAAPDTVGMDNDREHTYSKPGDQRTGVTVTISSSCAPFSGMDVVLDAQAVCYLSDYAPVVPDIMAADDIEWG